MNKIFGHLPFVLVYMDDILILIESVIEHKSHLAVVLELLREHRLYAKLKKCSFLKNIAHFLGHVVSAKGIHVSPVKFNAIKEWAEPKSPAELRSFLSFQNMQESSCLEEKVLR